MFRSSSLVRLRDIAKVGRGLAEESLDHGATREMSTANITWPRRRGVLQETGSRFDFFP